MSIILKEVCKMRYVGIGDLVVDCYYDKNNKLLFICGGKSFANIIANLVYLKEKCAILGCCGKDEFGNIAINTLGNCDTSQITRINKPTRTYYIIDGIAQKENPLTNETNWYRISMIDPKEIISNIQKEDILIFDNMCQKNITIINHTSNPKCLDIGGISSLKYYNLETIKKLYHQKFRIIQMNEKVYKFFQSRFSLTTRNIYDLLSPTLLIVTLSSQGAIFITKHQTILKKLTKKGKEKDPNGCGDAFFATMIKHFGVNEITQDKINIAFTEATIITTKVVETLGSRGHIIKL